MHTNTTDLLERAARHAGAYLDGVADRPVGATATSEELRSVLGDQFPVAGDQPEEIVDDLARAAQTGTVASQGPRYFGFVVGGSLPAATAADWLVSAWDQNAGIHVLSPLAAVAEEIAAGWIRDLAGLGEKWSAGFVTGCQMANFTALAAARHHVLRNVGWDVEEKGLYGAPPIDLVVSDESHYTIFTALRLLGLGAGRLRRVPTDGQGRMRGDDAARMLSEASGPCIVCAQAGNVNTGAFDPLGVIADAAASRGAWLHVDGAFGLWAAASPSLASLVSGIERVDSIATDAHKWLNVPYDSGIVLTAHRESHRRAMTLAASYIHATEAERDPHEFVPEESRRARGVAVYAALRSLGRSGLRELVDRCCTLARRMAAQLEAHPSVRILNDVVLNQVLVRVQPDGMPDDNADALTQWVIERVQEDGTCWLGGTSWHGMRAIRISVSNWSTTADDIDRSAAAILKAIDG
jgi:glutamate/tyrosine decarboxylase-like PLP-dependent enzyme